RGGERVREVADRKARKEVGRPGEVTDTDGAREGARGKGTVGTADSGNRKKRDQEGTTQKESSAETEVNKRHI
ncbi:hypothetical protein, partial [Staphylococcus pseudintermedius]|uniref:hypothetical protein n=1 Tax=Staphylococcus pseudintermedius TaxID=283734 RepID=UPI000D86D51D